MTPRHRAFLAWAAIILFHSRPSGHSKFWNRFLASGKRPMAGFRWYRAMAWWPNARIFLCCFGYGTAWKNGPSAISNLIFKFWNQFLELPAVSPCMSCPHLQCRLQLISTKWPNTACYKARYWHTRCARSFSMQRSLACTWIEPELRLHYARACQASLSPSLVCPLRTLQCNGMIDSSIASKFWGVAWRLWRRCCHLGCSLSEFSASKTSTAHKGT